MWSFFRFLLPHPTAPASAPATFAEEGLERDADEADPFECPGRMPAKKGLFVQSVKLATKEGTPRALADLAVDLRLSWVALLALWQHEDKDKLYEQVQETAALCRARNIHVWVWGWPYSGSKRIDTFVSVMKEVLVATKAEGLIINAEKPFYGRKYRKDAKELCAKLRVALEKIPIGLSSYGLPLFHPAFPWAEFGDCDFGMPQIYDTNHTQGPTFPQRCIDSWHEKGFSKLVPTWGASKAHTPQQMRDIISRTPGAPAACWWDAVNMKYSRERQQVVREMAWWTETGPDKLFRSPPPKVT